MHYKKRLLLTYPNQRWQKDDINTGWDLNPATLCLLAVMVKDIVDVKIIDAQFYNLTQEAFAREVENFDPNFVGISVMSSEYRDILGISAGIVKGIDKDIIVIAGGVHVTTNYDYVVRNKNIDYCVRGEGEHVLRQLIKYLIGKGGLPSEGLQNQAFVKDLSQLPCPAYDLIDFKAYVEKPPKPHAGGPPLLPYARMTTTRGCPFGCSFCQVEIISGKKVRSRNPGDVVDELDFLKREYGI
ncbi:MAG: cobalamin-dependent protein, partial [bacterium]